MLREIRKVRQTEKDKESGRVKRWFSSPGIDLFVWQERAEIVGFQLSFDKESQEQALTWAPHEGLKIFLVDDGWDPGNYPRAPLLIESNVENRIAIASAVAKLKLESNNLERGIVDFIFQQLERPSSE